MSESVNCECCEKTRKLSAPIIANPPGLSALKYRVRTHSEFKASMIARIVQQPALMNLKTREDDDFAIALLNGLAIMADVLTFYQERIANEGFLRTATERRSVLELARAIGYELKPGVAASVYLVFTAEDTPDSPEFVNINEGVQIMSVPGQDEKPQIFETVEEIVVRSEWNDLKPQQSISQEIKWGDKELYLKRVNNHLAPGDAILLVGGEREGNPNSEQWDFRILQTVSTNTEKDHTHITWERGLGHEYPFVMPAKKPRIFVFRQRAALFGYNAPDWKAMPQDTKNAYATAGYQGHNWPNFNILTAAKKPLLDTNQILDGDLIEIENLKRILQRNYDANWITNATVVPSKNNKTVSAFFGRNSFSLKLDGTARATLEINGDKTDEFILKDGKLYETSVFLDAVYPKILVESWLALVDPNYKEIYKIKRIETDACTNFTLSSKTSRLKLDSSEHLDGGWFDLRETVVFAQSEQLELANKPINDPIYGKKIILDKPLKEDLEPEQKIVVGGKRIRAKITDVAKNLKLISKEGATLDLKQEQFLAVLEAPIPDAEGNETWHLINKDGFEGFITTASESIVFAPPDKDDLIVNEICMVESVPDHLTVDLKNQLENIYDRSTVHIYANVALATHGEAVGETVGSGDSSQANQRFVLKKPPLTYVSATTQSGANSTIKVYVNDVMWQEIESLYGLDPTSQSYILRNDDDGNTSVIFGDGKSGARLPSGRENIFAIYRSGIGLDGDIDKNKLTLLLKKPPGIRKVTNPEAASGAASPEKLEDARTNAPFTVLTLGRVVSLKDFEDFARSFSGIGKAKAVTIWKGENRIVHITIAGANGKSINSSSNLCENLINGINAVCVPRQHMQVAVFNPFYFDLSAKVQVDKRYRSSAVIANIKSSLVTAFSFEKRSFGQEVTADEVITEIQNVPGVIYTDLDKLYITGDTPRNNSALPSTLAHLERNEIVPADLLLINKSGITLTEIVT